jgi:dUTP pyrophosphatase
MEKGIMPTRGSMYSVGYDLYCPDNIHLPRFSVVKIPIKIKLELPLNLWGQILSRSSMAAKGLTTQGGVIDPDYKGEISVLIYNSNNYHENINAGDKIAQIVFHQSILCNDENNVLRGENGFGSSGK